MELKKLVTYLKTTGTCKYGNSHLSSSFYVEGNCSIIFQYTLLQGKISFKNLKRVAKELGENLTDEELQV